MEKQMGRVIDQRRIASSPPVMQTRLGPKEGLNTLDSRTSLLYSVQKRVPHNIHGS